MTNDPLKEFLDTIPHASSEMRNRVRRVYAKALEEKYGGPWTAELEALTGISGDRTAYDTGMEMAPLHE